MKRYCLALALIIGTILLVAAPKAGDVFRQLWHATPKLLKPVPDDAFLGDLNTWLPNRGLRGLYGHLRKEVSYKSLEKLSGMKIFVKGPHTEGKLNLESEGFGHYNPNFPKWLRQHAIPGRKGKAMAILLQPVYDHSFRQLARTYFLAHQHVHSNPKQFEVTKRAYKMRIKNRNSPGEFLQEAFRVFANKMDNSGYDWYEANTAPGFWVRRSIDGTDNEFHKTLEILLKTHDADFLLQHR